MKKCMLLIALAALAAGTAFAQEGAEDSQGRKGKEWNRDGQGRNRAERMLVRDKERPGNPMTDEMRAELRAEHEAIRDLAGAIRIETDDAKKAALVDQLRVKLGEVADRMQAKQAERLVQAEQRLGELKERIEYAKTHRDELVEEHLQNILAGKRPPPHGGFKNFPNAKHGMPADGPDGEEMAPPPPGEEMPEDMPPPDE